jgi:hypothetical protein
MVESGVDLATVKEILGHSSIEMTMRYTHPTTEGKMNAVKALETQMVDIGKHHSSTEAKVVSIPKVISDSNK